MDSRSQSVPLTKALILIGALTLQACSTQSRYEHAQDFTPASITDPATLQEPTPVTEPRSAMGNPASYRVLGKTYQVQDVEVGHTERGIASWYGMKFHGHQTSNGEIFDVYKMTAAHKTLPLPSYVRVTRDDNGESTVVRVNDRGPFHDGRIIDLSYAAATKLGIHRLGTAPVSVEVLTVPLQHAVRWVQAGALSKPESAQRLQRQLSELTDWPVEIHNPENSTLHRVRIGPVPEPDLPALLNAMAAAGLPSPVLLTQNQL